MSRFSKLGIATFGLGAALLLAGCERPPIQATQNGYRGTGMVQVINPRTAAVVAAAQVVPQGTPPAPADGPKARDAFQNVKVLGDLSVAEFSRHMVAITQWVAPAEGCVYCHNPANLAEDSKYQKVVSRRMIELTQNVNGNWKQHTGVTGVTCYTCHRGQPVPANIWFKSPPGKRQLFIGDDAGQNQPGLDVGLTSLPYDSFSAYLSDNKKIADIRVYGPTALPTNPANKIGTMKAEHTYGLMMHASKALGVNCTFCHATSNFAQWNGAPQQRVTAWHGIRMAGDVNANFMTPLTATFPANRKGPLGDVAKVNCATCHQGVNKPLAGAQMAKDYVGLGFVAAAPLVAALPAPLSEPSHSVLYFDTGSATLQGEQAKGLAQLIATLSAAPAGKAVISGYHSATGELAANQELAKQRAFTVRDSLLAAGIAESRVVLEKPAQAEANLAGEDPAARRVEVAIK
jgi:photosynthetic reaction center cytochrome c subunit